MGYAMNWTLITAAVTILPVVAILAALPLWLKRYVLAGNVLAMAIVFLATILFIGAEYVDVERARVACVEAQVICRGPNAFLRMSGFGIAAFIDVFLIYVVSLAIEERIRRRDFDPEWQQRGP